WRDGGAGPDGGGGYQLLVPPQGDAHERSGGDLRADLGDREPGGGKLRARPRGPDSERRTADADRVRGGPDGVRPDHGGGSPGSCGGDAGRRDRTAGSLLGDVEPAW